MLAQLKVYGLIVGAFVIIAIAALYHAPKHKAKYYHPADAISTPSFRKT